ncbi:RCC1 domain-containing protein [Pseudomonas sp. NPDC090755]|uniref:RCC1 domain-containing protein n=1 Tax=Pseudomonas sp. NPDC090755 TaxID=3364481 RepID=UPI00383B3D7D
MADQCMNTERPPLHPPLVLKAREVEGYDGGIGITEAKEDLAITVYAWLDMAPGQVLHLYLNDDPNWLLSHTILEDHQNQDLLLFIERQRLRAGTLEIHYSVDDINTQPSERYRLLIKLDRPGCVEPDPATGISDGLQAPQVPEEIARFGVGPEHLEAGVEVTIPPFVNRSPVQWITLYWGGVPVRQQVVIDDPLAPVIITVPAATILEAGNSAALPLFYEVHDEVNNWSGYSPSTLIKVVVRAGDLPAPLVLDAVDGFLDVAALGSRAARVKVETPAPEFAPGNLVRLHWDGIDSGGNSVSEMLTLEVVDGNGLEFEVANAQVREIVLGLARVSYDLLRTGEPTRRSWQTTVRVIGEIFEVYGARSQRGAYYYANYNRLVASSRSGGAVHWQYEGVEGEGHTGEDFIDTAPERVLQVTYTSRKPGGRTSTLSLRPGNVAGVLMHGSHDSGCLVKDDGSLFGWSNYSDGLQAPGDITDARFVVGGGKAYAAITKSGGVVAWGVAEAGGNIPEVVQAALVDVQMIAASGGAFAALLGNGRVEAWGLPDAGGTIPGGIKVNLHDVLQIVGTSNGFATRNINGQVFFWGSLGQGQVADAFGAVHLSATNQAFAALKEDGGVHAWGSAEHGGIAPRDLSDVRQLASTSGAFAVVRGNGDIVAWGDDRFGGEFPGHLRATLATAIHLQGATTAFALLQSDGSVIAWGQSGEGATVPEGLPTVQALTATYGGFAALHSDRSVTSWGRNTQATTALGAQCIYTSGSSLVALHGDSQLQAWGSDAPDLTPVAGQVSYLLGEEPADSAK